MSMKTPLARVRGLGSARSGAEHFWMQRVTGVANLVLGIFFVALIVTLVGQDYASVRATLASPLVAAALLLLIVSGTYHMRLGMQTVIEDYIHGEALKVVLLMLNIFFSVSVALVSALAVLKLSLGA